MKRKGEDRIVYLFWEQSRNKSSAFSPPSTQSINKHKEKCEDRSCLWAILPPRSAYVPARQSSVIVSYNINKTLSALLESI